MVSGKGSGFFAFAGIFIALLWIVAVVLNASFLKLVTTKRNGAKSKYKEKNVKSTSAFSALIRRESMRLFKNAMVCTNCILGSVFMLVLPILALINKESLEMLSGFVEMGLMIPLLVAALGGMNTITSSTSKEQRM